MIEAYQVAKWPSYFVTRSGEVYSLGTGALRMKKQCINTHGYLYVSTSNQGKSGVMAVHRMVAETFLPKTADCVNHKDGNQRNNHVSNLEWCTNKENLNHCYKILKRYQGENHWCSKVTDAQQVDIIAMYKAGLTQKKIASIIGCTESNISRRLHR